MRKEGSRGEKVKHKSRNLKQLSCCGMKGRNAFICSVVGRKLGGNDQVLSFIPSPVFPVTTLRKKMSTQVRAVQFLLHLNFVKMQCAPNLHWSFEIYWSVRRSTSNALPVDLCLSVWTSTAWVLCLDSSPVLTVLTGSSQVSGTWFETYWNVPSDKTCMLCL